MGTTVQVRAHEVREGDFIPGLDNGYVIEVEHGDDFTYPTRNDYASRVSDEMVCITYNDADGGENYLLMLADSRLTINRPDAS